MKKILSIISIIVISAAAISPAHGATKTPTPKITKSTTTKMGGANGGFSDGPNAAAMAKYQACLAKAGIKMPAFNRKPGGLNGAGGTRPTGAPTAPRGPRPTFSMTPTQQKAFASCASLRPKFGGRDGSTGGWKPGSGNSSSGVSGTSRNDPAYLACLNVQGLPVQTMSDVQSLDTQNTKVIAAERACAGK